MEKKLRKGIEKALKNLGLSVDEIHLEHPESFSFGDFSTNVAMVLAKKKKRNPKELAEEIKTELEKLKIKNVEKTEVAGAGFINFYLKDIIFIENIKTIINKKEKYGRNKLWKRKKVLLEHSSPNLFKEFHIGHIVNNSIGESISRIFSFSGAKIKNISYPSDVGLGIAQAVWAIQKKDSNLLFEKGLVSEKIAFLGEAYIFGKKEYQDNEEIHKEVAQINKKIYNESDEEINRIYKKGKEITLEYFEKTVERLGSKFDGYFFESQAGEIGKKIVEKNIGEVFEKSDGAVIFRGENYGLHTRVFLNSSGLPIYEAKDLGLLKLKFDKYKPDLSVFVTDYEQGEYMKVVLKVAEMINPVWSEKTKHVVHGRLRFPDGRLSSRLGKVVKGNQLLDEIKEIALEKIKESGKEIENSDDLAEKISVGAIKYSILKSSIGRNLVFDPEKSLSFEGDSGPYLQYTFVRAKSILEKAKKSKISVKKYEGSVGETEKLLARFTETVERASLENSPHYIANYLSILAQSFNTFYAHNKVIGSEYEPYRLALTKAVSIVIKNGLWLLGIETPEKM